MVDYISLVGMHSAGSNYSYTVVYLTKNYCPTAAAGVNIILHFFFPRSDLALYIPELGKASSCFLT
jgi:hypothetical protein